MKAVARSYRRALRAVAQAGAALAVLWAGGAAAQAPLRTEIVLRADQPGAKIDRNIYGHFVEHLGRGVYEGIWVGEGSKIPNVRGIRKDVVAALRRLNPPVVRWPGGCFADIYQWRSGVGPRDKRPPMMNTSWGQPETNAFGTHEFMDFVEQIGAKPYIGVNMGSATPAEGRAWMEYMTAPAGSSGAKAREANGRREPWAVPYVGVGNESWGCGGTMRAAFYADQYRLYQTYLGSFSGPKPMFIAAGADTDDYHWTETVMSMAMRWREKPAPMLYDSPKPLMWGLSLHYYTLTNNDWRKMGAATGFTEAEWASTLKRALTLDEIIAKHSAIMDRYDPKKEVAIVVDEWGSWYAGTKGASALWQQNTLRDALVAGINLNIFHDHADRVRMANLAQTINVLQAVVLTDGERMILTPTFHVMEMYKVHQDATRIPLEIRTGDYVFGDTRLPAVSASASRDANGAVHLSVVNLDPRRPARIETVLRGVAGKAASARTITADALDAHNSFGEPDRFVPQPLTGVALRGERLTLEAPPKSVTTVELR